MDFGSFHDNLIDMIKEQQLKLGYCEETVRLYYPLQSLNRFLGTHYNKEEMLSILDEFIALEAENFGKIEISAKGDRFCIKIPPKGSAYVHSLLRDDEFINCFIQTIVKHGCKIEDIHDLFLSYSDQVHFEHVNNGEFDYLLYFTNNKPDSYRYCITDEGCHLTYHRYTPEDYEDFQF